MNFRPRCRPMQQQELANPAVLISVSVDIILEHTTTLTLWQRGLESARIHGRGMVFWRRQTCSEGAPFTQPRATPQWHFLGRK